MHRREAPATSLNAGRLWAGGLGTAAINLVVGLAIVSLLSSVAAMSMRQETPAPPYG